MRSIILQFAGYDSFNRESWVDIEEAYLLTDRIVLTTNNTGIWLYCFAEVIESHATSAIAEQARMIQLHVEGATVENIELSLLSQMSLIDLAETLAVQLQ